MARTVDIIVPVCNEEACIDEFYARVDRLGYVQSLIFVDNASVDDTVARLQRYPSVRIIRHLRNEGYGGSIRHGIASSDAERIIIIDADLEYPPEAIPQLLAALEEHAVVYASRFLGPEPPDMPLLRRVGNRLITGVYNLLFHQHTTDLYTGLKGLRRSALPLAKLRRNGFEHVIELGAMIAHSGERILDVPVRYVPRSRGTSKMRHVRETAKFLGYTLAFWISGAVRRRQ